MPTEFSYARQVLRGVIAATRQRNLLASSSGGPVWLFRLFRGTHRHSEGELQRWIADWRASGIICHACDERVRRIVAGSGVATVEVFDTDGPPVGVQILPDDPAVGRMAARHFIDRGFRHFAYFGNTGDRWVRERREGFADEIARDQGGRGIDWTMRDWEPASPTTMGDWLASLPRPCAVLAANDLWGSELVQAAREAGLRVPQDVAILGVDDDELVCEMAHPPLSSVRLGAEQMGHRAVALLARLMAVEEIDAPPAKVPPRGLTARQSTDVLAVEDAEVAEAVSLIRQRACGGLSVGELLRHVPINRRTLERRFVSILGHTPLAEIRRVRLERAKALLMTDLPVYAVAAECGFGTPEYLATFFGDATGMTPSDYRRRHAPGGKPGRGDES